MSRVFETFCALFLVVAFLLGFMTDACQTIFQVHHWPGKARRAERSGSAHPADSGAGEVAEGDDGGEVQAVHGRRRGGRHTCTQLAPLQVFKGP